MKTAVAYFRTSSATNVGGDKDSLPRQQDAVRAYAAANGLEIVKEYFDAAVSGADHVYDRDGFNEMLAYMLGNGARTVLVETAGRFARDAMVQFTGHELLKKHGIELIPVDAPTHFTEDSPTARMVCGILAYVSAFERETLVARLKRARERIRKEKGHCEGAPQTIPQAAVEAAQAARGRGLTLRAVAAELAAQGFLSRSGRPFGPESIKHLLQRDCVPSGTQLVAS